MSGKNLNLSISGFVSEEGHSGCKSQNIAIRALKGNRLIKRIKSTGEVPQRISSHLETIVSRALQPQDGRIPCPVDRNLEIILTSRIDFLFIFEQSGDNWK